MQRGVDGEGRAQRAPQGAPTPTSTSSTSGAQTSEKQAAKARQTERHDRAPGGRRGAAQGVGAADDDRGGAAVGRGRRHPARRRGPTRGDFTLGPVDLQLDWARPRRDHRRRTGPASRRCSALLLGRLAAGRGPRRRSGSGVRRRRGRPGARRCSGGDGPWSTRSPARSPDWPTAEVRTLLAKFGLGADHVAPAGGHAVARRAHPRRPRAAAGPRGEPARARRADQPPRPPGDRAARDRARRASRARCCWSPTTGACSRPSACTRRWHVDGGQRHRGHGGLKAGPPDAQDGGCPVDRDEDDEVLIRGPAGRTASRVNVARTTPAVARG